MLKVIVLGCGSSFGVPVIACNCKVCSSNLKYNKRTRSSIYIDDETTKILVDFGFDIKYQLTKSKIRNLDAAILTHYHSDHSAGFDNLRIFPLIQKQPLPIFSDSNSLDKLKSFNQYLFQYNQFTTHPVNFFDEININSLKIQFFQQDHGSINSLGIRINDFVYSTDVVSFPQQSLPFLKNIKVWILDCRSYNSNMTHAGLDKILEWNNSFAPKKIYLTNMNHSIEYTEILKQLPENIEPLYDGYKIIV